jgi:hypothetical protein
MLSRLSGQQAARFRYSYGVAVSIEVKGTMKFFNIEKFANGVIACLVLFTVPKIFFEFVTLYCMGTISETYRSAKRVPFNLYDQLHQVISRMMVSQGVFRSLICDTDGKLNRVRVTRLLEDMFEKELRSGEMSKVEFAHIIDVVMNSLANEDGDITCNRFLTACSSNDLIRMAPLVKLLCNSESQSKLAQVFDGTSSKIVRVHSFSKSHLRIPDGLGEIVHDLQAEAEECAGGTLRRLRTSGDLRTSHSTRLGEGNGHANENANENVVVVEANEFKTPKANTAESIPGTVDIDTSACAEIDNNHNKPQTATA